MNNFPSKIPVFPLSNFIMFPKTTVPLNIFEPRYIDMVNDAMKSNKQWVVFSASSTILGIQRSVSTNPDLGIGTRSST